MANPSYQKPALTVDQQLQRLIGRGMQVANPAEAKHYLQTLNYYRLAAYWLGMEADHASHQFTPGASFERVLDLYVFDREFRLLLWTLLSASKWRSGPRWPTNWATNTALTRI